MHGAKIQIRDASMIVTSNIKAIMIAGISNLETVKLSDLTFKSDGVKPPTGSVAE